MFAYAIVIKCSGMTSLPKQKKGIKPEVGVVGKKAVNRRRRGIRKDDGGNIIKVICIYNYM